MATLCNRNDIFKFIMKFIQDYTTFLNGLNFFFSLENVKIHFYKYMCLRVGPMVLLVGKVPGA